MKYQRNSFVLQPYAALPTAMRVMPVPTVANLLTLAGLCADRDPAAIAEEIGDGGGGGLKKYLTEVLNEKFAPIRARRAELEAERGHIEQVLRAGNERANAVADATLAEVRQAMGMVY